jgi:hypothetical protein
MRGGKSYTAKLHNRMYKTNVVANLSKGKYTTTVDGKYTYNMKIVPPSKKKQGGRRTHKNRPKRHHRMKR